MSLFDAKQNAMVDDSETCKCEELEELVERLETRGVKKEEIEELAGVSYSTYSEIADFAGKLASFGSIAVGIGTAYLVHKIAEYSGSKDLITNILIPGTIGSIVGLNTYFQAFRRVICEDNEELYHKLKEKFADKVRKDID